MPLRNPVLSMHGFGNASLGSRSFSAPTLEDREAASRFIDHARGLSSEQMTPALAERFNENSLPADSSSFGGVGNVSRHVSDSIVPDWKYP